MLITLLALIAVFFLVRFAMLRFATQGALANAVAAAVLCAFGAGFLVRGLVFGGLGPTATVAGGPIPAASAPAPSPTPVLPGKAVTPLDRVLTKAQLGKLISLGKPIPYSVIEAVGGTGPTGDTLAAGADATISGWAADPATKGTAAGLLLIVDGKTIIDATKSYGRDRIDVAEAFKTRAMLHTGFSITLPTGGLSKGLHHVAVAALRPDGKHYRIVTATPKAFTLI